jgi:hypothetical protein
MDKNGKFAFGTRVYIIQERDQGRKLALQVFRERAGLKFRNVARVTEK